MTKKKENQDVPVAVRAFRALMHSCSAIGNDVTPLAVPVQGLRSSAFLHSGANLLFPHSTYRTAATPMLVPGGTLGNEPNTWSEPEPQEGNIDEETETCVGVRVIISTRWNLCVQTSEF